jgi:hypothetical protein
MSYHQSARQNHNIKDNLEAFKKCGKIKIFWNYSKNKNHIQEEIQSRLNFEKACHH